MQLADFLLGDETVRSVLESSLHRAKHGHIWIATYAGPEGQVWRSTGMTDRDQALLVARRWEAEARAQREKTEQQLGRPVIRVRRSAPDEVRDGPFSHREIALALRISERSVRRIERGAIEKLKRHAALRQIWGKYLSGELDEQELYLMPEEVVALRGLTRTDEERRLVENILRLIQPE